MRTAWMMGALALAGCTSSSEMRESQRTEAAADLARELDGRIAGTPANCIANSTSTRPMVIDEHIVLYREGGRIWRNDLAAACPRLTPYNTMIVEVQGGQLCRNDRFRVLEPGTTIPGPYCRFGQFVPYERK
ncbi:hypothetical protein [Sphingomonas sp. S2-65]|uniref:hypothetical protein n=1 Tax=Sphingomonas sp. S2-65 TaxID=2903960 RepID=UPI001F25F93B|nr:hypothetical protein [Sphingomonas sp. S2-65]UYY59989.1 hypothetical protein LZ586_07860 [Sphingomonas sp. S2-65]